MDAACVDQGGADSCADVLQCAFACQGEACLEACVVDADAQAMELWSALLSCIINICGADSSPECWLVAAQVACNAEYAACLGDN